MSIGRTISIFIAAVAALPAVEALAQEPATAAAPVKDWGVIARQDVEAAYELYVENHPGMHDPGNPGFPEQLKKARDAALAVAAMAHDREGYSRALARFTGELGDGHAQVYAPAPEGEAPRTRLWPGFVAAWRGEQMIVHRAAPDFPVPSGSAILSCGGAPVPELVSRRLMGALRAREAGQWWSRAPQAFMAFEGYTDDAPRSCRFRTPAGDVRDLELTWVPAPSDHSKWMTSATDGERTAIGLSQPRQGIFLIGMPTFGPDPDEVKAYRSLFESLGEKRAELKGARAVVIDLRHNNGGSSTWSREAVRKLWGKEIVDHRLEDFLKEVRIWWRASEGNTAYMKEMEDNLRADGNADVADAVHEIGAGMKAALANGEKFYVEGEEKDSQPAAGPLSPTDFTVPVYVITPGRCASACLDAIDAFKLFSNVKLIGAPTSADSTYMEVRRAALPSGEGMIVIPNKVWMHRPRGSGEFYTPDIEMTAADWSTAAFLDRIEADLSRR